VNSRGQAARTESEHDFWVGHHEKIAREGNFNTQHENGFPHSLLPEIRGVLDGVPGELWGPWGVGAGSPSAEGENKPRTI
jgi:hypothetical protein